MNDQLKQVRDTKGQEVKKMEQASGFGEDMTGAYRALYVGRFQVFHNGHLSYAKFIDQDPEVGEIYIAVGSAQYSRHKKNPHLPWILNPFTFEERKSMLEMSLEGELEKPITVVPVDDLHNCPRWFSLIDRLTEPDILYTNSTKEIKLFESNGIATRPVRAQGGYHAQVVREMIMHGDGYHKYVPKGTVKWIEEFGIEQILREFYGAHEDEIEVVHGMQRRDGIEPYDPGKTY
jgi:nicotinamide-nucleotide adenylyltransferase